MMLLPKNCSKLSKVGCHRRKRAPLSFVGNMLLESRDILFLSSFLYEMIVTNLLMRYNELAKAA
jgi:hypothetical protein